MRVDVPAADPARLSGRHASLANSSARFQPWWVWWGLAALWWTIDGWISAAQIQSMRQAEGFDGTWGQALLPALASAYLWVPLSILALWSAARFPIERDRLLVPALVHSAGALLVSGVRGGAVILLNPWIGWYVNVPPPGELFVISLRNNVLIYWLLVGVGHAVHYARAVRLEREQLARAQLLVLKSQLQPHFLFNALNTITAHVRTDPDTAERIVERLSRLLRQTLESAAAQEVSLGEELATLDPYIEIEQTRFEDRLTVLQSVDRDVLDAAVPHLVLQPLVENAIRHGTSKRASGGTVEISARRERGELRLRVKDDGVGLPPGFRLHEDCGVGLRNTNDRLAQLYGAPSALEVRPASGGGTEVILRIPYRAVGRSRS